MVPEGASVPSDVPEEMTLVQQPLDNIYLAATSTMDFFRALDGIGNVTLSSLKADDWYIPEAKNAMENGTMTYAGKYRAPDYELILSKGCDLALENTMIYHTPEAQGGDGELRHPCPRGAIVLRESPLGANGVGEILRHPSGKDNGGDGLLPGTSR